MSSPSSPDSVVSTVAGIRCLHRDVPGMQLRAGITFRVGSADETYVTRGLTHLVEHLVMHTAGDRPHHHNAYVDAATTTFHAGGTPGEVWAFLRDVCTALTAPDVSRLEVEKRVLRSEAEGRSGTFLGQLLLWRFGLRGHGLADSREWALESATPDDVSAWIARYFTADNAVLWMSREPAPECGVELPRGERLPPPDPVSIVPGTPAHFFGSSQSLGVSFLHDRSGPAVAGNMLLARRLHARMRLARGLVYDIAGSYQRLTPLAAHVAFTAAPLAEVAGEAHQAFVSIVESIASEGPTDEEMDLLREGVSREMEPPDLIAAIADEARTEIIGGRVSRSQWLAELDALTPVQVAEAAFAGTRSALWMLPPGSPPPSGSQVVPMSLAPPVSGRTFRSYLKTRTSQKVVVGAEGITLFPVVGAPVTVLWTERVGLLSDSGDGRAVIGSDGVMITVPTSPRARRNRTIAALVDEYAGPSDRVSLAQSPATRSRHGSAVLWSQFASAAAGVNLVNSTRAGSDAYLYASLLIAVVVVAATAFAQRR